MNVTRRSATRATCYFLRRSSEDDCGHAARRQTGNRCKKKRCPWFETRDIPQTCMCHVILSPLIRFPFRLRLNVTLSWSSIFCGPESFVNYVQLQINGIGKMRIKLSVISALRVRASWISIFCIWGRKQCVNCLTFVPELLRQFPDLKLSVIIIIALVI